MLELRDRGPHQVRQNRSLSAFPAVIVEIDGEQCLVSMSRDITQRKQMEHDLITAREDALAASRAKSEFLSSMSHEIRTPMNAVLGMADLLLDTKLNAEQRRYLDVMVANGNSLLELINSILDLARIESGRMQIEKTEFDLTDLIDKTDFDLRRAGAQQRPRTDCADSAGSAGACDRRSAAAAPGSDQLPRQRDQIHRKGRGGPPSGPDRRFAAIPPSCASPWWIPASASRPPSSKTIFSIVHPGGFLDHPQIRRHRARARDRAAPGDADGRHYRGRERTRQGQQVFLHDPLRARDSSHFADRARGPQPRSLSGPGGGR